MNSTLSLPLVFLSPLFIPPHNEQMRLLKTQIHILWTRIPTQRVILSPHEKSDLLRIGAYVLIFIHLGSRRVFCSAPTYAPGSARVTQQARNTLFGAPIRGARRTS